MKQLLEAFATTAHHVACSGNTQEASLGQVGDPSALCRRCGRFKKKDLCTRSGGEVLVSASFRVFDAIGSYIPEVSISCVFRLSGSVFNRSLLKRPSLSATPGGQHDLRLRILAAATAWRHTKNEISGKAQLAKRQLVSAGGEGFTSFQASKEKAKGSRSCAQKR